MQKMEDKSFVFCTSNHQSFLSKAGLIKTLQVLAIAHAQQGMWRNTINPPGHEHVESVVAVYTVLLLCGQKAAQLYEE